MLQIVACVFLGCAVNFCLMSKTTLVRIDPDNLRKLRSVIARHPLRPSLPKMVNAILAGSEPAPGALPGGGNRAANGGNRKLKNQ